ncbi:CHD3-type chromatin-remodeling factor PICKLE-like [Musa acuminata AAA Group]|uniref:CHD3-type chromatin-remodeling factor PICKLE-like n=1 Tax=Musa acuminata AAA Group TaxID=214697 RepID=UPI0031D7DD26
MSSLVERLRVRSEKRPLYNLDDSDDDDFVVGKGSKSKQEEKPAEKIERDDAKEDSCQMCGTSGSLIPCATCTYAFHKRCLYPTSKAVLGDKWSCPECVSPLTEIEKILDCEMRPTVVDENDSSKSSSNQSYAKQYLVKWKGFSYLHCIWVPEKEFLRASKTHPRLKSRLNNFHKQLESMKNSDDDWVAIRPEWTTVDRIISSRKTDDEREFLVKWKDLSYDECTWEVETDISTFRPEIERYEMILSRRSKKFSNKSRNAIRDSKELKQKHKEFQHCDCSPEFISGTLHAYQLEGLNFLRFSWSKNTHVILADEMGLGKTIQSIAFLASLFEENISPHLVVAPLSTLRNWEREFATWAPQMNVVMYGGSSQARDVIKQYEFYYPKEKVKKQKKRKPIQTSNQKKQSIIKFNVLLTSYEMINMDSAVLKSIEWESMIVDEGHRLKNKDSKLFHQLKLYSTKHRVLLTGTPLQNNLDELFMLMHFLDAGKFASIEDFQKEFKDINQEEQIDRLHKMLAPHLLRRVKKDVMKDLPPKKELILRVELSSKQKEYYKAILTRNYQILARRGGAQISLINVVMELRKLCCHAYMLEGVEPATEPTDSVEGLRQLLDASGKMQLLDKMMVKLKEQGHRVLIYSQFQHMLDLLEDYLSYKKWTYERIDGKVSGAERQIRIDRFNAKNSTKFCFLLSTRAGGLGINLATADTVFIYDSDWNPHADLQAMARAHRLGQTNKVMIYRLITRGTIEERMMQMTKKKMILEHLVVGRLKAQNVNQEELDDIIRYGSKELFVDESDEAKSRQIHYDDSAIDRLLNRDHISGEESSVDEEEDDFLKAFKVANFEYIDEVEAAAAEEEESKKQLPNEKASNSNTDRANYWDELLKDRYEVQQIEEFTSMGKGKRSRKQMASAEEDIAGLRDVTSEDEDYSYEDDLTDTEASIPGSVSGRRGQFSKRKTRGYLEPIPLMEGEGKSFRVLGFNQNQRSLFQQLVMRFGFHDYSWKEYLPRLKGKSWQEVQDYAELFMRHLQEDITDLPNFSDGVPKEGARVDDILVRIAHIQLIEEKMKFMRENPGANLFPEDVLLHFPGLAGRFWKEEHDLLLLKAKLKHGYARWQYIIEDEEAGIIDIVRRELNLPTRSFSGSVQTNESANSAQPANTAHNANGSTEAAKAGYNSYQSRELQRRLVESIRKRYFLLEKALELECYKKKYASEQATQDPQVDPKVSEVNNSELLDVDELLRQMPQLEHICPEELACDNKDGRTELGRLYNEMCLVVEENAVDTMQAHLDDASAISRLKKRLHQLEIIHEDVHQILAERGQPSATEGSNVNAADTKCYINRESSEAVLTSQQEPECKIASSNEKTALERPEQAKINHLKG